MKIEERYAQVSDTSHQALDCYDEALDEVVGDGWRMIQCRRCLKRWDSDHGRRKHPHPSSWPIDVEVVGVDPHPAQSTTNPSSWAVRFRVVFAGKSREFSRWHDTRDVEDGRFVTRRPTNEEVLARFWDDTFAELHGFDFEERR